MVFLGSWERAQYAADMKFPSLCKNGKISTPLPIIKQQQSVLCRDPVVVSGSCTWHTLYCVFTRNRKHNYNTRWPAYVTKLHNMVVWWFESRMGNQNKKDVMGEVRSTYKIMAGKLEQKGQLRNLGLDKMIMLKCKNVKEINLARYKFHFLKDSAPWNWFLETKKSKCFTRLSRNREDQTTRKYTTYSVSKVFHSLWGIFSSPATHPTF